MSKRLQEMTATELEEATKEFDAPFAFLKFRSPDPRQQKQLEHANRRAKRKMGRPVSGDGAQRINISVERALLKRIDAVSHRLGLKRSELIARSMEITLAMTPAGKYPAAAPKDRMPRRKAS